MERKNVIKVLVAGCWLILVSSFLISGCSTPVRALDKGGSDPQVVVNPEAIRLSVVWLKGTNVVFTGSGFRPKDSVFVKLLDVEMDGKKADLPIASGEVDDAGNFSAPIGTLSKFNDILRADLGMNEKMENIIIITKPPIPEGLYTARVVSMASDKTAECKLNVKGPGLINGFKDWMGVRLGKIQKK